MENISLEKTTNTFLIPSTVLVAALGVAGTEALKLGICVLGLIVGVMWVGSSREAYRECKPTFRAKAFVALGWLFLAGYLFAAIIHADQWRKELL